MAFLVLFDYSQVHCSLDRVENFAFDINSAGASIEDIHFDGQVEQWSRSRVQTMIEQHRTQLGFLIVAVANYGHKDFVLNWVESMRRHADNTDQFVIIALDQKLYSLLKQMQLPTMPLTALVQRPDILKYYHSTVSQREQVWDQLGYFVLTNLKMDIVYELVKDYDQKVIFTDVDLVWLRPRVVDYLDHIMRAGQFDIAISADAWGEDFSLACTGFYAINTTDFAISFLERIVNSHMRTFKNDQQITNEQVLDSLSLEERSKIHYLPLLWFMNGNMFDKGWNEFYQVEPWIFHANYRIGSWSKRQLLQQAGVWYLES